MNKLIAFEAILLIFILVSYLTGGISLPKAGQVILGIGIIDLVIGIFSLFGWRILRGDVSDQAPLNKIDSREITVDNSIIYPERPSTSFGIKLILLGIIVVVVGLVVILIFS
jgi:hypothetical protein